MKGSRFIQIVERVLITACPTELGANHAAMVYDDPHKFSFFPPDNPLNRPARSVAIMRLWCLAIPAIQQLTRRRYSNRAGRITRQRDKPGNHSWSMNARKFLDLCRCMVRGSSDAATRLGAFHRRLNSIFDDVEVASEL